MKKYLHALQGNLDITVGKTIKAEILCREGDSIILRLQNGLFATLDFDNVFMKSGPFVWARMIAAKNKYEKTRVRITHVTHDGKIKVVPWGRYDKYANVAKTISDALTTIEKLKNSVSKSYSSLKKYEEKLPDLQIRLNRVEQALSEADKKAKAKLLKEKEEIMSSFDIIADKEEFIKVATSRIIEIEELLKEEFTLLEIAN